MSNQLTNSELNYLIAPEIKNDEFYAAIQKIAREEDIKTVLEIGSSSGEGSTEAFVTGLRSNPHQPKLFCMEVSKTRFVALQQRYKDDSFVKCYNVSSVPINAFPKEKEVIDFYNKNQTNLNFFPLERILGWLQQDIEYVKYSGVSANGIQKIKEENNIVTFDLVLIDGSEFTGIAELDEVYGAKYICLDDINTFKNYKNHQRLKADKNYSKIYHNDNVRNGYSIFKLNNQENQYFFENEIQEQLLVRKLVNPGMLVFDIGANIGDYSILLSKLVGNRGKVYTFEASQNTFEKLKERLTHEKCVNTFAFQKAVYSENTQIEFNEFSEEYSAWNSIGKPQMLNPDGSGEYIPIVNTEVVEAITLDNFCQSHNIQKINFLKVDVEGAESDVLKGSVELLQKKAIKFIQFEISQKMLEGLNREAKATFDILSANGYECHRITPNGEIGEAVEDSNSFYENYIAFPVLPINFFTIVLNGEPFIRHHIEVMKKLPFKWHWHIVEGVAELKHDTAWSIKWGGCISEEIHRHGRSNDGTTEYLNELAQLYPDNVTIYRKPEGNFWDGKLEMVNAPLVNINEECLLWQIDVDELWTVEQICTGRQMFINSPEKTAAFYWCWYFVGENLVISTRNCYTQNPQQEWLRTWRFKPGAFWTAHEPPVLVESLPDGKLKNVAAENIFLHDETEKYDLVFQHFAYVTKEQLQFKEQYYGYNNAVSEWLGLQAQNKFPVLLNRYFSWVQDHTIVDRAKACGIVPIAQKNINGSYWKFLSSDELQAQMKEIKKVSPIIIIDGIFFQMNQTGIARVWKSLLEVWADNGFGKHIIVADRGGTAPKIDGIKYVQVPLYDYDNKDSDRVMLQELCDSLNADLFTSTYYTSAISTPSAFMAYDMIPEILGWDLNHPMWQNKHLAIKNASAYMAISENTAHDLVRFFPQIPLEIVQVAYCGVTSNFFPANQQEINNFKTKYGISKPYFMIVSFGGYKNTILFLEAFAQLYSKQGFDIVCTGGGGLLDERFRAYTSGNTVYMLQVDDEELKACYSGAVALVYPSKYEGFGLPVLEAMACGCPVITCANASIPEVGEKAVLYVQDDDVQEMADALCEIQKPSVRKSLITAGLEQAKKFSWTSMANIVSSVLIDTTLLSLNLKQINLIIFPDWSQPEELLCLDLKKVIYTLATNRKSKDITLLIYTTNIPSQDSELLLSGIIMNILMEEEIDISEELTISLVREISEIQWNALLPRINCRIILPQEDKQGLAQIESEKIKSCSINNFN